MTELWTLIRWMAEVVATGEIENDYFYMMPDDALEYLWEVGANLVAIFG